VKKSEVKKGHQWLAGQKISKKCHQHAYPHDLVFKKEKIGGAQ
jgi:hypothetical protein